VDYDIHSHINSSMQEKDKTFSGYKVAKDVQTIWPTEASIEKISESGLSVKEGACVRAVWYRINEYKEEREIEERMYWIWAFGNWYEKQGTELLSRKGHLIGSSIRFKDNSLDLPISGEMDAVLIDPETNEKIVVDFKTAGGSYYSISKLKGNTKTKAFPKISNLLQIMIYLNKDPDLDYGILAYKIRDDMTEVAHKVRLVDYQDEYTGNIIKAAEVNGTVYPEYNIEEIFRRYQIIIDHYKSRELPPRDYYNVYPDGLIDVMYRDGLVTKTSYAKHKGKDPKTLKKVKQEPQGDWQCRYCNFFKQCQKDGE